MKNKLTASEMLAEFLHRQPKTDESIYLVIPHSRWASMQTIAFKRREDAENFIKESKESYKYYIAEVEIR